MVLSWLPERAYRPSPLKLTELTALMKQVEFKVFRAAADLPDGRVAALCVPGGGALSRKQIDDYTTKSLAAKGRPKIRSADLFRLAKAMPSQADMSGVLLQLNQIAADTGITFQSIAPQNSVPITGYQAVPIQLTFEGNFYSLVDFLFRLRNLVDVEHGQLNATGRLFAIDTLSFDEAQAGFPQISATLVVDAFVYGTATPATATPTTTTATTSTSTTATTTTTP